MNNNREERRQMRQRGAATRKIKEVDFDFSFGLAPPPEEPSEPASQSELANGPPGPSAPSEPESSQPPPESAKQNTPPPPSRSSSQRTPRFDVLADEAPDLGRSSKRRKIDSPPTNRRISPRRSSPLQNGTQTTPPVQPPNEPIEVPTATNATEYEIQTTETVATSPIANNAPTESPQDVPKPAPKPSENGSEPIPELASKPAPVPQDLNRNSPEQQPVQAPEPSPEQLPHEDPTDVPTTEPENQENGVPYSNHVEPKSPPAQQTVSQPIDNSSPADSTRSKRKRGTKADQHSPQSASPVAKEDAPQAALPPQSKNSIDSPGDKRKTRGASAGGRSNASPEITDHSAQPPAQLSPPEQSLEAPAEQRKTRGANGGVRLSKSASPNSIDKSIRPSRVSTPEQSVDVSAREGKQQGANARARSSKSASPRSVDESAQQPPQDATPDQPLEVSTSKGKTRGVRAGARSAQSGSPDLGNETAQQTKQASQTEEPRKATRGKRKRRGSSASGRTPPQSVNTLGTADKEVEHPPPEEAQDTPAETVPSEPQPAKRQRGRPQRAAQNSPAPGEEPAEKAVGSPGNNSAKESSPPRREPRGPRNRNVRKPTPEPAAEEEEPAAQPTQVEGGPETNATNHDESRQSHQKSKAAADKRTGRGEKTAEPAKMSEEIPRPGRKGKKARKAQEQEQTQERESQPEPEPEVEPEPEPSTRKRGQGKPSQSKKDGKTPQPEERATQDNVEEATTSRPKRKPRQPRGETVPVTVHRLANVASLGGAPLAGTSSDEEEDDENDQETAEELSTRLKAKLPNRGGVNVADVLSQICRETLEKTLTTLNNGIDNEGIAARRSEWVRKKKAVEAYGTELEGRLYELSEMLDSNFVLGVQLRKSKREMLDQRTRLFQLRKEREAVALRMDAVRQKHSEEENARATRSTINHSLHNIDLALERSKKPQPQPADSTIPQDPSSSTSSPTIGLEFLLRNVAENASSRASGAQGGLLSQIRAFNAQLESTARRLES